MLQVIMHVWLFGGEKGIRRTEDLLEPFSDIFL